MEEEAHSQDICRVCRCEGTQERPLFHPCVCTGSIKFIHQDCLVQWLKYSHKEYCELCKHNFSFTPIYSPDMPKRLPITDIVIGIARSAGKAIWFWFHYTAVILAWLGVVPLAACRIYKSLFTGSVTSLFKLPLGLFTLENLRSDIFQGIFVVLVTLAAFIGLLWLREQILHGGGPDWLDAEPQNAADEAANAGEIDFAAAENEQPEEQENEGEQANNEAPVEEEAVANNNNGEPAGVADDLNWNPIEWDRAAEEFTWERLLGLDGSTVFVEHVFWVVSLNTVFIFVFAFCPYHIGHFVIVGLKIKDAIEASHFEGFLTTLIGYFCVGFCFVVLHTLSCMVDLARPKRIFGLCYVVVKVALLFVCELVVIPLVGGWWLDICSLSIFEATLKDRGNDFRSSPGTSMFVHWFVGLMYVFYFASSVHMLREVLRPGVLWFLRNLNDPDFNPIQEMIHLPLIQHTRRFFLSVTIFGSTVLLMFWLPTRIINFLMPDFLPYQTTLSNDIPHVELSWELVLLQVILPALLDQSNTRAWLKYLIKKWCLATSYILGLRSYLLGNEPLVPKPGEQFIGEDGRVQDVPPPPEENDTASEEPEPPAANDELEEPAVDDAAGGGLGAAHQALLQRDTPTGFQPYIRPTYFGLRLTALVVLMCMTLTFLFAAFMTVPVWVGRKFMYLLVQKTKIHEVYTGGCGLYMCFLGIKCSILVASWIQQGWSRVVQRVRQRLGLVLKVGLVTVVVAGVIPLMVGLLAELIIMSPIKVPLHQTPLYFFWQHWIFGILYTKVFLAFCTVGPNWWMKTNVEQIIADGIRDINLDLVIVRTALPIISVLGSCLAIPYVIAKSIVPIFVKEEYVYIIERTIYTGIVVFACLGSLLIQQLMQFAALYENIKNDKYLVGKRLVNYYHGTTSNSRATNQIVPELEPVQQDEIAAQ